MCNAFIPYFTALVAACQRRADRSAAPSLSASSPAAAPPAGPVPAFARLGPGGAPPMMAPSGAVSVPASVAVAAPEGAAVFGVVPADSDVCAASSFPPELTGPRPDTPGEGSGSLKLKGPG